MSVPLLLAGAASAWLFAADRTTPVDLRSIDAFAPVSIAVESSGPTILDLPAERETRDYLVVVGSLSTAASPSQVVMHSGPGSPDSLPIDTVVEGPTDHWRGLVRRRRESMAQRRLQAPRGRTHQVARFPDNKSFYLFVAEEDFRNPDNYREVIGRLVAVGRHCLVYVDEADKPATFSPETVREVIETFDKRVYPSARQLFGDHLDVDRNGKFTILFTQWLNHLSNGKVSLGGFVRGGDFYRDVQAPYSNQCDMMYLNSNLRADKHLRSLIAHEYVHAITFSEHVFGKYLVGAGGSDEEAWLNEAISHLAENLLGDGWSNLDYRISTYLSKPNRYPLVVPDYFQAGLWRCHGCRGATFLFLRWCVDRFGVGLLGELSRSNLQGIDNLEAATQTSFADLFRQWSLALSLDELSPNAAGSLELASLDLRDRLERRLLAGALWRDIPPGRTTVTLAPTSFAPLRVRVPADGVTRLAIQAPAEAALQVTVVRLPSDLPRVTLAVAPTAGTGARSNRVRLSVDHSEGSSVRWERVTWEAHTLPQTKTTERYKRATIVATDELFSDRTTLAGQSIVSDEFELTPRARAGAELVFKLAGVDRHGRRVVAWTVWNGSTTSVRTALAD